MPYVIKRRGVMASLGCARPCARAVECEGVLCVMLADIDRNPTLWLKRRPNVQEIATGYRAPGRKRVFVSLLDFYAEYDLAADPDELDAMLDDTISGNLPDPIDCEVPHEIPATHVPTAEECVECESVG